MRKVILLLNFIFLLIALNAKSATITTFQAGNWNVPNTWIGNKVPLATDDVILNHAVTVVSGQRETVNSIQNNNVLNLYGAITVSGLYSGTGTINTSTATGELFITGSETFGSSLTFTGTQSLTNFSINRVSSGIVTLGSNLTVSGTLTLTAGLLMTGTNKITLGTGTSNIGTLIYSTNSWVNGNLERWIPNSSNLFPFPIGTDTYRLPASVFFTSASSGGKLLASAHTTDPGMANINSINDNGYMIDRYSKQVWWNITTSDITGGTYELTLDASSMIILGVSPANYTQLRVLKRVNSSSPWITEGVHGMAVGSPQYYNPIVYRAGLTTFSEFGIGGYSVDGNTLGDDPLPVTLKSFTSSVNGRNVKLNWITEKETNNKGFEVQRKSNNEQNSVWKNLGFVDSKEGSNSPLSYTFEDKNLASGKYSYRLKQVDYNGNFEYFELAGDVVVGVPSKFDLSQNYPNPFNPVTKINFDLPEDGKVTLKIYDMLGREAATLVNETRTAGFYTVDFNASSLSSGMYFYRLTSGKYSAVKKMAIIK